MRSRPVSAQFRQVSLSKMLLSCTFRKQFQNHYFILFKACRSHFLPVFPSISDIRYRTTVAWKVFYLHCQEALLKIRVFLQAYQAFMAHECPTTCGTCSGSSSASSASMPSTASTVGSSSSSSCADKGTDCPKSASLCTNAVSCSARIKSHRLRMK